MSTYKKILVALDVSQEARAVLAKAEDLAQRYGGAELVIIHVIEPMALDNSYESLPVISIDVEKALYERAQRYMAQVSTELGLGDVPARVEIGSVKGEILRVAEELEVDLMVIGTHGRHGMAMLLGSTANAILHGTRCDVLAVRV
jgi:universal stress protein A